MDNRLHIIKVNHVPHVISNIRMTKGVLLEQQSAIFARKLVAHNLYAMQSEDKQEHFLEQIKLIS